MRLLNAKTLKLHSFQEGEAPDYAILSHVWHAEEVLFEDLQDVPQASKKTGFAKVQFCCNQAIQDYIEFVWIDTCCIDKTSSTELSEAINSMYRWYRNAEVCYAYLRDVSRNGDAAMDIGNSRWFKRAWTLQELLAPLKVVFYSNDWTEIGTKHDLSEDISKATGIDQEYLFGYNRHLRPSVAKRMSWAAKREATRAEDIAYSLFGIFDVHMPLLYGEGEQKAFRRLQEEIMKFSNDHTLFTWWMDSIPEFNFWARYRVLAPGPYYFAESRDLIPTEKINLLTPYSITNIGLRISLPLNHDFNQTSLNKVKGFSDFIFGSRPLPKAPEVIMAALNCHKEGDFLHMLALPLLQVGSNQFVRHPKRRLEILPIESLSKFTMQEVFIRDEAAESVSTSAFGNFLPILPDFGGREN